MIVSREETQLGIPVEILITQENIGTGKPINKNYLITTTDEGAKLLGNMAYGSGETLEEAKKQFWISHMILLDYFRHKAIQADKWTPIMIGPWKKGGKWFTVFGFGLYFRIKQRKDSYMKSGIRIPFTLLNVRIMNFWKRGKKEKDKS